MIDTVVMKKMRTHVNKKTPSKLWITALLMTCLSSGVSKATTIVDNFFENEGTTLFTLWAGEWITPEEVVRLDTALCNTESRSYWTNITNSILFQDALVISNRDFSFKDFSMLLNKFVKVKGITFPSASNFRSILRDPAFKKMSFPHWDRLDFKDYDLTDEELLTIIRACNLKNLEKLSLSVYKNMTDENLKEVLKGCPNLKSFTLYGNYILNGTYTLTEAFPSSILTGEFLSSMHAEQLEELTILGCHQNLEGPYLKELLARCPNLKKFTLGGYFAFTGEFLSSVRSEELEELTIDWCKKLTEQHLKKLLGHCPNLKKFTLKGNDKVTGDFLSSMQAEKLEQLIIYRCRNVTAQHLKELLGRFPNLKKFTLHSNDTVTGEFLCSMQAEKLEELSILSCDNVTENHLKDLLAGCPNLKKLTLSNHYTLTGEFLSSMQAEKLEELNIYQGWKLTDQHLKEFLARCPNLKKFKLHGNSKVTGEFLSSVRSKKLEELAISSCKKLTEQQLKDLVSRCPNFKKLTSR